MNSSTLSRESGTANALPKPADCELSRLKTLARYARYNHSEKGLAKARKYRKTQAYKINIWLYHTSPEYRLRNQIRMQIKRACLLPALHS